MRRVPWWVWVSAAPMGLGAWTPIVPGIELQRRWWTAWGVLWSIITIVGWAIAVTAGDGPHDGDTVLDLDGNVVERLRDHVVFRPR